MKKALVLARKDLSAHFQSWLGVLVYVLFVMLAGAFFCLLVTNYEKLSGAALSGSLENAPPTSLTHFVFGSFLSNAGLMLTFLVPILSMKAFSEEIRHKTLELLFTYPLSDFDIVAGKFLAQAWYFFLLLFPTLGGVAFLWRQGIGIDWGMLAAGYLGLFLFAGAYLSFGLFISALTESPAATAMITFVSFLGFNGLDWAASSMEGPVAGWVLPFSPLAHFRDFTYGVVDVSHMAYFVFFSLYFLFLSLRVLETRHWKG